MPSYFYHLKFELYATPNPRADQEKPTESCSRSGLWLPPVGASIFDELPAHPNKGKTSSFALNRSHSYQAETRSDTPKAAPLVQIPTSNANVIDCGAPRGPNQDNDQRTFEIVTERQWRQRTRSLPPPPSSAALTPQTASADWRFGQVSIETIDLRWEMAKEASKAGGIAAPSLGPSYGGAGTANKAECLLLHSKITQVGWGVVHFYREGDETPALKDGEHEIPEAEDGEDDDEQYTTLCIPAVPAYMSAGDFLGFVGEKWREDISHCRLVMTSKMNRYLALLKFRSGKRAKQWRQEFDGRVFNTMEVCLSTHALTRPSLTAVASNLPRSIRPRNHLRNTGNA